MTKPQDVLAEALYEAMQETRSNTRDGAEFDNEGDWTEWVQDIIPALAARGYALVRTPETLDVAGLLAEMRTPPPLFDDGRPNPNGYEGGVHDAIEEVLALLAAAQSPAPPEGLRREIEALPRLAATGPDQMDGAFGTQPDGRYLDRRAVLAIVDRLAASPAPDPGAGLAIEQQERFKWKAE